MPRIALVSTQVVPHDAVGNDVAAMYRLLSGRDGHEVAVFAEYAGVPGLPVRPLTELAAFLRSPEDVLIYHHSTGWEGGPELFCQLRCRKVLRYHNVTPVSFFEGLSDLYTNHCRVGRAQLPALVASGCERFLSASAFNQHELIDLGAEPSRSFVVHPFHDVERLPAVEADPDVVSSCTDGRTNLLFVGRVAPNKGHVALLEAFAVYHHHLNPASRLVLVGREDPSLQAYSTRLRSLIEQHDLRGSVVFAGSVSDAALKAYYQTADVFLSTSEHEGFCVPLVEAMSVGVPVIAVANTGVPDTVGSAGLVWPAADAFVLAESVHRVVRDAEVRTELGERGRRRFRERFASERIEASFWESLNGLCA